MNMDTVGAHRRAGLLAFGLLLIGWLGGASTVPAAQSSETPLVVDFYALGADGAGIADLKAGEVNIRLNGRARTIRTLRLVKQADLPPDDPLAPRPAAVVPFGSNGVAESGRSFVVVIDDESFRPGRERPVRTAIGQFLSALSPRDRVALWTVPHGGMKVDLTPNHDRLSQAMQVVAGHGPENETGSEAACRSRTALESTEHMMSLLAGGEGPTTVLFLTASLLGPRRDAPVTMAPGMCELTPEHFQRLARAAAAARAHFFVVQTEDLMGRPSLATENVAGAGFRGNDNPLEGIEHLAGVTGGTRVSMMRQGDRSLIAIARSTASFYSAVIEGASSDIEGAHGLDVRTTRAGATIRSRALLHVKKPTGPLMKPATPAEMLKSSASYTALPLRVAGYASLHGDGASMRVISAAEPIEPNVKFVSMSAALFDSGGRMVAQANATDTEIAQYPALVAMASSAGTYRLRVAAVDAAGRTGAADVEVVADTVASGPLKMSSLVLGLSRDLKFQPRMQFGTEPVAIAYLDLFGREVTAPVGAIIEVLTSPSGNPIVTNRLAIEATADPGRYRATGAVPIGALPPGDYIARVIVVVEGYPGAVVYRAFRKSGQ